MHPNYMHVDDLREDIQAKARELVGNWRKFRAFAWRGRPENAEQWCIVYTSNRDSDLLALSNAAAFEKALAPFLVAEDSVQWITRESHSHWAVGHVDGYAIRVFLPDGVTPSPAFAAYAELRLALDEYPIADEEDLSRRESEATYENVGQAARRFVKEGAPDTWQDELASWLEEHDQGAVEPRDGGGGYPSDEQCKTGLEALGYLKSEES